MTHKHIPKLLFFIVLLCTLMVVSGCQETPNSNLRSTSESDMVEKVQQPNSDIYPYPDKLNEKIVSKGFDVIIDAEVDNPISTGNVECFSIKPHFYDLLEIQKYIDILNDGTPLYDAEAPLTKSEIEDLIISIKQEEIIVKNENVEDVDIDYYDKKIAELEKLYEDAPDTIDDNIAELKFKTDEDTGVQYLRYWTGKNRNTSIDVLNPSEQLFLTTFALDKNGRVFTPANDLYGKDANISLSRENASSLAEELVKSMNIDNMTVVDVYTGVLLENGVIPYQNVDYNTFEQGYVVVLTKKIDNINVSTTQKISNETPNVDAEYAPVFNEGYIEIHMDDSGITSFRWIDRGDIVNDLGNYELLSFEEIIEKMKSDIIVNNAWLSEILDVEGTIDLLIDKVALNYETLPIKDNLNEFMLVPAWNFIGHIEVTSEDGTVEKIYETDTNSKSYLTLNAIDGSIISD